MDRSPFGLGAIGLIALGVGIVAAIAYKNMSEKDRDKVLSN